MGNESKSSFLDPKKNLIALMGILIVGGCIIGGWWFISRRSALPSPSSLLKASPMPFNRTLTVPPGLTFDYSVEVPNGKTPGHLHGHWISRGSTAGMKGATDDTLVGYTLRGPDNKVIESMDHPLSGNFSVRVALPGTYTFVFDNHGIIRSSARTVTIEGSYDPD